MCIRDSPESVEAITGLNITEMLQNKFEGSSKNDLSDLDQDGTGN